MADEKKPKFFGSNEVAFDTLDLAPTQPTPNLNDPPNLPPLPGTTIELDTEAIVAEEIDLDAGAEYDIDLYDSQSISDAVLDAIATAVESTEDSEEADESMNSLAPKSEIELGPSPAFDVDLYDD